jgi:hypothetical protein
MALPLAATAVDNGTVLMLITLVVVPVAAVAFARSGKAWRDIGRGPFAIDQDLPPIKGMRLASPVDPALQEAEAKQMLEAKSYRRQRRGEAALDVEAEVRRALDSPKEVSPGIRAELRGEIRQLVLARNERRLRKGQEPLDVEAETERQLSDCIGSS